MGSENRREFIRIRGARQNNLKGFDLDLPTRSLIVVTGLSGSGKSSLAFDTLYAEGQRRYIETFSPYARQFFDRVDKPQVDAIEGIPPAVALEQRNSVRTTRSTVGTMTEICDYMKVLWPHVARLHCRQCGKPVTKDSPQGIWERLQPGGRRSEVGGRKSEVGSRKSEVGSRKSEVEGQEPEVPRSPKPQVHGPQAEDQVPASRAGGPAGEEATEVLVTFDLPLSSKLSLEEQVGLVARQGYQRLLVDGAVLRVDEAAGRLRPPCPALCVIQDRLRLAPANRARFVEACEQAYHFGHGRLTIHTLDSSTTTFRIALSTPFSHKLHCAACDLEYHEPFPALFSYNNPVGACPACKGFGRIITIDFDLAIPDRTKTLAEGAVKPWQTETGAECQRDLARFAKRRQVPLNVAFRELTPEQQRWVIEGDPGYGEDDPHKWPHAWYGVKGYFRWLESKAYKMHVRVLLSRYRAYRTCPTCAGQRFQPETLLWGLPIADCRLPIEAAVGDQSNPLAIGNWKSAITLADFYALPIRDALLLIEGLAATRSGPLNDPISVALLEVRYRLRFLEGVGLGYLTLGRATRTLSGGETQRVNLTTSLGTGLVNTLFVLDEPSVGLHPRDTDRLVHVLQHLRDLGNTVVVVEHEPSVMRAADQIVDLGPGHGESGGQLVFQGPFGEILKHPASLTGAYLSGRERIPLPSRRPVRSADDRFASSTRHGKMPQPSGRVPPADDTATPPAAWSGSDGSTGVHAAACVLAEQPVNYRARAEPGAMPVLVLRGITRHNLRQLEVAIPLGRLVCLTGVSGSGKTTLAGELLRLLHGELGNTVSHGGLGVREAERETEANPSEDDEMAPGSPRNAALDGAQHLGAVLLVDQSPIGRTPRSNPAVYTGAFDHIREVFARSDAARERGLGPSAFSFNSAQGQCERCRGAGYEKIEMQFLSDVFIRCPDCNGRRYRPHILEVKLQCAPSKRLSIADVLDLTVDDAIAWLDGSGDLSPAGRAAACLRVLQDVGLGYLRLGQPINTLSGGESQRLKLAGHLAESAAAQRVSPMGPDRDVARSIRPRAGDGRVSRVGDPGSNVAGPKPTLFVFDEPTTGLHFEDIRVLLRSFQRLVDAGHTVLIIEHNLEVVKCADWIIDLGPDAGDRGGQVVVAGTPEDVAACEASATGQALKTLLSASRT